MPRLCIHPINPDLCTHTHTPQPQSTSKETRHHAHIIYPAGKPLLIRAYAQTPYPRHTGNKPNLNKNHIISCIQHPCATQQEWPGYHRVLLYILLCLLSPLKCAGCPSPWLCVCACVLTRAMKEMWVVGVKECTAVNGCLHAGGAGSFAVPCGVSVRARHTQGCAARCEWAHAWSAACVRKSAWGVSSAAPVCSVSSESGAVYLCAAFSVCQWRSRCVCRRVSEREPRSLRDAGSTRAHGAVPPGAAVTPGQPWLMASSHTGMSGCDSGAPPVPAEMSQRVEEPLGAESHGGAVASREPRRGCPGGAGKKHCPVLSLSLSRPVPSAPRRPARRAGNGRAGITAAPNGRRSPRSRSGQRHRERSRQLPRRPRLPAGHSPRAAPAELWLPESGSTSRTDPAPQPARVSRGKTKLKEAVMCLNPPAAIQ